MKRQKRTTEIHILTVRIEKACFDVLRREAFERDTSQGRVIEEMIRTRYPEAYARELSKAGPSAPSPHVQGNIQNPLPPPEDVPKPKAEGAKARAKRAKPEEQKVLVSKNVPSPRQAPANVQVPPAKEANGSAGRNELKEQTELEVLKLRMAASDISLKALSKALGMTSGNGVRGWFVRSGQIPPARKEELEAALKHLEKKARAVAEQGVGGSVR